MENFHVRLIELMEEQGLSYRGLAARLKARGQDVSHEKIGAWARDERLPNLAEAVDLAHVFGVSLEYLATGEETAKHAAINERERDLLKAAHVVGLDRALRRIMAAEEGGEGSNTTSWQPSSVAKLEGPRKGRSRQMKRDHKGADRK